MSDEQLMICENAAVCKAHTCSHMKPHKGGSTCYMLCTGDSGIKDSSCIFYKETTEEVPVKIKINDHRRIMPSVIPAIDMKPLDIGVIVGMEKINGELGHSIYTDIVVMRTASIDKCEIMNLSDPKGDKCWSGPCSLMVRILDAELIVNIKGYKE